MADVRPFEYMGFYKHGTVLTVQCICRTLEPAGQSMEIYHVCPASFLNTEENKTLNISSQLKAYKVKL